MNRAVTLRTDDITVIKVSDDSVKVVSSPLDVIVSVGSSEAGPVGPQGDTGDTGAKGDTGAAGAKGDTGAAGSAGSAGANGAAGAAATIAVGTTTTGAAGTSASVSNAGTSSSATFNFTIPQGAQGPAGAAGSAGSAGAAGAAGAQGAAATIAVGTTTTGAAGTSATVTNSGTSAAATFNFTIPQGAQGAAGTNGTNGTQGAAATIAVGTTATGAAGTSASVSNAGTSSAATFNFTIPQGAQGAQGSTTVGTSIDVTAASTTATPLIVRATSGQTSNVTEWKNSSGNNVAFISPGGLMGFGGASAFVVALYADSGGPNLMFGLTATADSYARMSVNGGILEIKSNSNGTRITKSADGLVLSVRGAASQTANLQEWQSGATGNAVLASINKDGGARFVPRVTTNPTPAATPTINTDNTDAVTITALGVAITSMTTNLTGTPNNFDKITFRIKDDATARAITWGAKFVAGGVALPTTTVASKVTTVGFIYDTVKAAWSCVACVVEA